MAGADAGGAAPRPAPDPDAAADAATATPAPSLAGYGALLGALEAALTDQSVERLTDLVVPWAALIGSAEVRDLVDALGPLLPELSRFVRRLTPLVQAGLLDRLVEVATLGMAVLDAVTPLQAERLAVEAEGLTTLAHNVMTEDPALFWRVGLDRLLDTWEGLGERPRPVGLGELLRLRRDPGVQRALRTLLALAGSGAANPGGGGAGAGAGVGGRA
jgi:hypothetical protein